MNICCDTEIDLDPASSAWVHKSDAAAKRTHSAFWSKSQTGCIEYPEPEQLESSGGLRYTVVPAAPVSAQFESVLRELNGHVP